MHIAHGKTAMRGVFFCLCAIRLSLSSGGWHNLQLVLFALFVAWNSHAFVISAVLHLMLTMLEPAQNGWTLSTGVQYSLIVRTKTINSNAKCRRAVHQRPIV